MNNVLLDHLMVQGGFGMVYKYVKILVILMTLVVFSTVISQEVMDLTLEKSLDMALQYDPEYQIARKEADKASSDVLGSYAGILPQLDAYANYQRAWKIQESTIPNFIKAMLGPLATPDMPDYVKISFGLKNTILYGARVNLPLFQGGAGIAGIKAARAGKRAAEQNLEVQRQNLIFNTVNAFYTSMLAKAMVAVQEDALNQARANLEVVQKKHAVGAASGFDKMRAEVEVANQQPIVINARNSYQSALTQLRTLLDIDKKVELNLIGKFVYAEDAYDSLSLDELQALAVSNRPELMMIRQQRTISGMGVVTARSNFLPKLYFSTDYSYMAMQNDLRLRQDNFSEGLTSTINLQIPIFHGFSSTSRYQKAKLDYKITLDMEKQLLDVINAEVEFSYNNFQEAREKYSSANETVSLATEALRLANLMYEEGTNTQVDVLSSRLALTQARMNYISSIYEYMISRYQLRKATGALQGIL
jgi:outer membrane protein